ncbi:MAG: glycosyltransferase family 2 protein [Chitinophagaceae bacterium]|nr:glycosyltransferase family 2 protein [Chitinophagaceae bacterium]
MQYLSVVIVCKNAGTVIGNTLQSLQGLTDDIIVYDNGSTDDTIVTAERYSVRLYKGEWEGFGKTKRKANALAAYSWILSLDADEAVNEQLKESILQLSLDNDKLVYDISFNNYFGNRWLKYGEWGKDHHIRLFNKTVVNWNDAPVHEELVMPDNISVLKLNGAVRHRTAEGIGDFKKKMTAYASLNAEKYFKQGKKAAWSKKWLSSVFSFIQNYFLRLGFLDGMAGFQCAVISSKYTFNKYKKLEELWSREGR